jgi:23S rRNA-/tRNA-specific pseudouridylate synthase
LFKGFDKASGKAKMFINKQKWVEAKTSFITKKYMDHPILGKISLIEVHLYTGRMHQIRIHMASIWNPILWDITYWDAPLNRIASKELQIHRQLLHSRKYWFFDVFKDKQKMITTAIPERFTTLFSN